MGLKERLLDFFFENPQDRDGGSRDDTHAVIPVVAMRERRASDMEIEAEEMEAIAMTLDSRRDGPVVEIIQEGGEDADHGSTDSEDDGPPDPVTIGASSGSGMPDNLLRMYAPVPDIDGSLSSEQKERLSLLENALKGVEKPDESPRDDSPDLFRGKDDDALRRAVIDLISDALDEHALNRIRAAAESTR